MHILHADNTLRRPNVITDTEKSLSVTDVAKDPSVVGKLDYETWLPYAAKLYQISPDIRDYYIVKVPICPSGIPNRNGIGFPLPELLKFQPPPVSRQSYKAWSGTPLHYEHKNDIHEDAYGVVFDTRLVPIKRFGNGLIYKVMGLAGIDKYKYAKMAQRVIDGDINTYSMGALADGFSCSYCNTMMSKKGGCHHIHEANDIDWNPVKDYDGRQHIAFRNAHGIQPIELSLVESPAWTTATSDAVQDFNGPGNVQLRK